VVEPPLLHITPGDAVVVPASVTDPTPRAGRLIRGELIGQGGFGMVYKATRTTSVATFDYALKLLDPSPFIEDHEKASKRFARESRALQRLQHRAIVPYVETGMIDGNQAYILMPLIEGRTLRDAGMDPERVLWTFGEILGGLVYLHAQNIIHRDLKPSNIIVRSSDLQPLILDFGCAYLFDDVPEKTLTNTLIGSAAYVPPEVHADPTMRDPRQDIYACGIMLYEVLRGHRPDPNEYVTLESMISGLAPLDDLVQAAIAPFKKRIATAKEFENRLTAISI
jgi:serine/threonine protein kinase